MKNMKTKKIIFTLVVVAILILALNYRYFWQLSIDKAIEDKNITAVELLVKVPFSKINSYNLSIFRFWELLVKFDYDTPLVKAIREADYEIVKLLIRNGADVNYYEPELGPSPLEAVFIKYNNDDLRILSLLFNNNVNVDSESTYSENVLYQIASQYDVENYNISKKGQYQYNERINMDIKKEYMEVYGRKREIVKEKKEGSLIAAVNSKNLALIKYLLKDLKYNPNVKGSANTTPLFFSFDNKCEKEWMKDIICLLLSYGADKSIKDIDGKTAYDYAKEEGAPKEILKLLKP
ncbi:MAG: hypothetical protein ACRCUS_03330 [Anaerovoracaceae bacterium]